MLSLFGRRKCQARCSKTTHQALRGISHRVDWIVSEDAAACGHLECLKVKHKLLRKVCT
jgi:hypothetical protein